MKILLVKMSSMGDVIHTLAAVTDAKSILPDLEIHWVVEEGFQQIPTWHPGVKKVIPLGFRRLRKNPLNLFFSNEWRDFVKSIRAEKYDLVIDAQGLLKSVFVARKAKVPVAGLDEDSAREPFASRFYRYRYFVDTEQHAVERTRQLIAQALSYPLPGHSADFGLEGDFPTAIELPKKYLFFIHSTTWPEKHWPEQYWQSLAEKACQQGYSVCLPWSSEEERSRANRIASVDDKVIVLKKMSLHDVAAVIKRAECVVAVDTGLGHLTAALNKPAISLYGPTSPKKVGAYGCNQKHLEASKFAVVNGVEPKEMAPILPEKVWQELQYFLHQKTIFEGSEE